ncbi:hypothetical protein [Paenibacillus crassostreae]|uniref:Uncharacterized protein n=1 Tax=Paenibacillus crassostreae TaxID=1763538 RepID=A0A167FP91_9BACL|nr:hypothetical protein [Paenibacillus crassostreae]AOZ94202.1 hypothetical protein LPB68_19740 [Paenibacillus crassostreae]OAB76762.1 hypothetical protein PNBC_05000 [Paenibacillus crassostreae]
MNIGSLIRGLLGDTKVGDSKQLDVKTGQVVRGVVLSVSEDGKEAEIQIQGVKVHAKVETPLQQGQATLLQVQPPGEEGMLVLKPLTESPHKSIPANTLGDVLKAVGLTDTKANRQMLQTLQSSGVPLTKENVALFSAVLREKPVGVPAEQWLQSAAIAFQRGLPMTGESVRGLQQAVFGPPLHQLLAGLSEQLTLLSANGEASVPKGTQVANGSAVTQGAGAVIAQSGQSTAGKSESVVASSVVQPNQVASGSATGQGATLASGVAASNSTATNVPLQPLLAKLQDLLLQVRGTQQSTLPSQSVTAQEQPATASPSGGSTTGAASPPASLAAAPGGVAAPVPPAAQAAATMGEAPAGASLRSAPTHGEVPWVGQMLKLLGAEHEQLALRSGATPQAQQGQAAPGNAQQGNTAVVTPVPQQPQAAANPAATTVANTNVANQTQMQTTIPLTTAQPQVPVTPSNSLPTAAQAYIPVPTYVQDTAAVPLVKDLPAELLRSTTSLPTGAGVIANAEVTAMNQESLKGVLLQMLDRNDLPPALKEAAQQLVQHMTGQQLLLNTDRTAPFAQVTMFIPLNGQDGEETASVHIQSRRGKKGELDASNCRLWFDLEMKHLGTTLVDVQVVDKIVSLKIHNDNEWMTSLIDDRRDEISQSIQSIGYQLLSLKTEPLPLPTVAEVDRKQGSVTSEYTPPTYKGVDMRI